MIKKIQNKKNRSELWKKLNFKYRISATNENTLEEIWKFKTSIFWGSLLFVIFASMVVLFTSIIIIATPIRFYLPGYLDVEVRDKALQSAIALSELEEQVYFQEAYLNNLKNVLKGVGDIDSAKTVRQDTIQIAGDDPMLSKTTNEKAYTERYAEDDMYNLSILASDIDMPMSNTAFYKPVKGFVIEKFSPATRQYGLKINIANDETLLAVLEGTVMNTGYSASDKYSLQIQHSNGFVSVYKHATMLTKKIGDKVKKGEAIAVATVDGNDEETTKTDFVVFELWHMGKALDPQSYIFY